MYPTKHYINLHNPSKSSIPKPLLVTGSFIVLAIFCVLFLFRPDFDYELGKDDSSRGSILKTESEYEIRGPKPYFVGDVDTRLLDVQNETLGFQEIFIVSVPDRYDKLDLNALATSLTGIKYKQITGMAGKDVPRVTLPVSYDADFITDNIGINTIGAWRSELNAVRQIITDRLSTALILEDDQDWDVALKNQLLDIARGGRFMSNQTAATAHSPYGDNWDVLWLGHCGMAIHENNRRRFVIHQDPTTPPVHRLHTPVGAPMNTNWEVNGTRLVFNGFGTCSWAYAVSNIGAHKIVKAMSVDPFNSGFDNGMGEMCKKEKLNCLAAYPPVFGAYEPQGDNDKLSDINHDAGEFREKADTRNIAYSVKLNLDHLIRGEREKAEPQWNEMPELDGPVSREYIV